MSDKKTKQVYILLPDDLHAKFYLIAKIIRRMTLKDAAILAIEQWVDRAMEGVEGLEERLAQIKEKFSERDNLPETDAGLNGE